MDSRIYILTHKRLTGQLSSSENDELQQLSLAPANKALSEEISYLWNVSKSYFPTKDWQKDAAKEAFYKRIKEPAIATQATPRAFKANWIRAVAVAAILLLGVLAIGYLMQSKDEVIKAVDTIDYAEIMDGTKVWLDIGAKLTILEKSATARKVALEGEAIFDVSHNPSNPFTIDLGEDVFAEVLGTSFKARSTHDGSPGMISVREGKVRLYSSKDESYSLILTSGEEGELLPKRNITNEREGRPYTAFSKAKIDPLKFNNTSLDKVFDQLGLYYGVSFSYQRDQIAQCSYSGVIHADATFDETLQVLKEVHPDIHVVPQLRSNYNVSGSCK